MAGPYRLNIVLEPSKLLVYDSHYIDLQEEGRWNIGRDEGDEEPN